MAEPYRIAAIPTRYKGVLFRSRLEARWAAFFDLAGWRWEYEPLDIAGWIPDFLVEFPCGHSECSGSHTLLCEVKPYMTIGEFKGHPCMDYSYGFRYPNDPFEQIDFNTAEHIPADASAAFGYHPRVSWWEMGHGAGGGEEDVANWVDGDIDQLWNRAGELVMYKPPATGGS